MGLRQPNRKQPPVSTTMRIPPEILAAADVRAQEQGLSRTHYVVTLIERDVKRRRAKNDDQQPTETPNKADIFG